MNKLELDRLIKYVKDQMKKCGNSNNISISLRDLGDDELAYLRNHFKTVERQGFFNYIEFEVSK